MHTCPVEGCLVQLPQHILMCRPHWYKVGKQLRSAVIETWKCGPHAEYLKARQAAIDEVNRKINPTLSAAD
jgi:hypothetical protein